MQAQTRKWFEQALDEYGWILEDDPSGSWSTGGAVYTSVPQDSYYPSGAYLQRWPYTPYLTDSIRCVWKAFLLTLQGFSPNFTWDESYRDDSLLGEVYKIAVDCRVHSVPFLTMYIYTFHAESFGRSIVWDITQGFPQDAILSLLYPVQHAIEYRDLIEEPACDCLKSLLKIPYDLLFEAWKLNLMELSL